MLTTERRSSKQEVATVDRYTTTSEDRRV